MIIDERMEELASLYVIGALTGPELAEFQAALQASPKMQQFLAGLQPAVEAVAGSIPVVAPPPELRAKILARVAPQKVVTLPERSFPAALWWLRAIATGLAALCIVLLLDDRQLHQTISAQNRQISELQQLAQTLQSATNSLNQTVLSLRESNRLANVRITMLNSLLADAPKMEAVTLWDYQSAGGVLVVQNFKNLPPDKDYELWVMDEQKTPVPAGVFHPDASGTLRLDYKAGRFIKTPGQFCVTEEVKGGVAAPTIKNLVLASN